MNMKSARVPFRGVHSINKWILLSSAIIVVTIGVAYSNSFTGTWVLDDKYTILENPHKSPLWPPWNALWGPKDTPSAGRPIVSLSFALNYALGGEKVWGYHLFNLGVHILAALFLFGVIRLTLAYSDVPKYLQQRSILLALVCTLIWALHPLQTGSVTYISQRAESLMGLFYLLTLYCAVRGFREGRRRFWFAGAIAACVLGGLSKEVAATAPVIVLLYDRAFVSQNLKDSIKNHWPLYLGMIATWLITVGILFAGTRARTTGFHFADRGLGVLNYLGTQCNAIVMYLKLTFWPHPLVLDYGDVDGGYPIVRIFSECTWSASLLFILASAGLFLLWKKPKWGFLVAWFILILSPSSSFIPIASELVAEHRMYLSLASVIVFVVAWVFILGKKFLLRFTLSPGWVSGLGASLIIAIVATLATVTFLHNQKYQCESAILTASVKEYPNNQRAQYNAGTALAAEKKYEESIPYFEAALRLKLNERHLDARNNLALSLIRLGRYEEAYRHISFLLKYRPDRSDVLLTMGTILANLNRLDEAVDSYKKALELRPNSMEIHRSLISVLVKQDKLDEALQHLSIVRGIHANSAQAHFELGGLLEGMGHFKAAAGQYEEAEKLKPDFTEAVFKQGFCAFQMGQVDTAMKLYEKTLRLNNNHPDAHNNIGAIQAMRGKFKEAMIHFQTAIHTNPKNATYHVNLGNAMMAMGYTEEATHAFQQALAIDPHNAAAQSGLAAVIHRKAP
jgi:tetratricopeptide (TPR) repeat protein